MKISRKRAVISSFILLDFLFGGIIIGGKNISTSTTTIVKGNKAAANEIVDEVNIISGGIYNVIGSQMLTQEDLVVSQNIMLNDEENNVKRTKALTNVVNTTKTTSKKSKTTLSNAASEEKRIKEQEAIINEVVTTKNGTAVAAFAKQFDGNPYVWGGTSLTKGADCSGFTQSVYKHFGIDLPRTASAQAKVGKEVSINAIQPGDLVFYSSGQDYVTHAAIYIGNGQIIHARTPAHGIGINSVFIMRRLHIRRVIN